MADRLTRTVVVAFVLCTVPGLIHAQEVTTDQASVPAQQTTLGAPAALSQVVKSEVKVLRSGPLLIHGNYCGIGNRQGTDPIDPLDTACMHHDACTATGSLPSCACDDRLRTEATAVAQDPQTPPDVQAVAFATAASMTVLICR